jgi:hypothetical protein
MATPKTDIEQSVGRILREKHSNPVVVDIVDSHDLFKNQWKKRKTFYKRENYKIIYTTTFKYTPDTSKWETVHEPTNKKKSPCVKTTSKKTVSLKSNSSTDKSITNESDSETELEKEVDVQDEINDKHFGKCLLKIKK